MNLLVKNLIKTASAVVVAAGMLSASVALPGTSHEAAASNIIQVGKNGGRAEAVVLGLDKSIVLELPADAHDILVANPGVADAVSRTARRIYLFGKSVGTTNIFVFDKQGRQIVNLDLQVERDVAGLDRYLGRFIPRSNIKTEIINDNIILTGTVETPQDSAKAQQLAEIFVTGGERADNGGGGGFGFFNFGGGNSQIVNLLEISGGDQVHLKVTVAEIQRSVLKQLGVNVLGSRTGGNGITFSGVSNSLVSASTPPSDTGFNLGGMIGGLQLDAYLRAMEEAGVMKALATPTLTAVSGEQAEFRVGGSVNVAGARGDDGTREIDTIDYGVGLNFTPVVLSPGRISLQIRTEVSEPVASTTGGITAAEGGLTLRERIADTTIELPSGGSMVIAGLIQDDVRQTVTGFPVLKDLPVLGTLFRSREYTRSETELVIMVTPYLVRPVPESAISLPTDNFNPPSDRAGNLLGRVNRIYGNVSNDLPNGRYHGAVGFIYK